MRRSAAGFTLILILGLVLAACGGSTSEADGGVATLTENPDPQVDAAALTPTASPEPDATPTPTSLPPLAVLLAPTGSETALVDTIEPGLNSVLEAAGVRLEVRPALVPPEISAEVRLVIVLPPDPGLAELVAAAPHAQFLAVGLPGFQPGANLSLIGPAGHRPDQAGFIAGVMAAMMTSDWRVGVLGPGDTPLERASRLGFLNGAVYFCGLCLPYHGPSVDYPVYQELPAGASPEEIQAAIQALKDQAVETVYLPPGVADLQTVEGLALEGMDIIGSFVAPAEYRDHWIATIDPDPLLAVLELLPVLLAGEGDQVREMAYTIRNVNPALLSAGRLALLEEIKADLMQGYIDTGVDPLTGELR